MVYWILKSDAEWLKGHSQLIGGKLCCSVTGSEIELFSIRHAHMADQRIPDRSMIRVYELVHPRCNACKPVRAIQKGYVHPDELEEWK